MTIEPRQIEALQQAFTSIPAGDRCEDCPEPEDLWAAVKLELPAKERRRIVQHAAVCAACAEDWRVTWKLSQEQQWSEDLDPSNGEVIPGPWTRFQDAWPQVAAAALVLLAVGVGGLVFRHTPESRFRGESETSTQQAEGVTPDGAVLPRDEFVLRWPATEGAEYELLVMTEDGDKLETESGLRDPEFRVRPEVLRDLPSGSIVVWQFQVADPVKGKSLSPSFTVYVE